ncbi:MAG: stage 0 sporulation family protein [Deltaproteobacteria bacterium]|nr:stage 0 sporulation family protein [Deltaproteobacteria bacterium]MBW2086316.1 stage 0 sporulation family protein [Deltaproteobacteria bacterium]
MNKVVGIRFRRNGPIYFFATGHFVLHKGDRIIVKTEQGVGLGEIVTPPWTQNPEIHRDLKKVFRMANKEDLSQHKKNIELEGVAFDFCLERIKARNMEMKLVTTEVLFDGSKIIFYYTADGRVDFRELVKDLVARFRTRIEMRQIGVRHEAKMIGGVGCCGRELCCATFLSSFDPVSVRMAKEQNLSLNPAKISGLCGRLMCCLNYEFPTYMEQKKGLAKVGKRVMTKSGPGKVIRQNIMARTSIVLLSEGGEIEIGPEDIIPAKPGENEPSSI